MATLDLSAVPTGATVRIDGIKGGASDDVAAPLREAFRDLGWHAHSTQVEEKGNPGTWNHSVVAFRTETAPVVHYVKYLGGQTECGKVAREVQHSTDFTDATCTECCR